MIRLFIAICFLGFPVLLIYIYRKPIDNWLTRKLGVFLLPKPKETLSDFLDKYSKLKED